MRPFSSSVISSLVFASLFLLVPLTAPSRAAEPVPVRSLDGSGNNLAHPDWGQLGKPYLRVAPANYADGIKTMVSGPPARYTSNRIFNDLGQNIFSENQISQWGWLWGQFLDHTFGLRIEAPAESAPIPFSSTDPLERFKNDASTMGFARTPAAPDTGVTSPRQQTNTVSSYIDAFAVYGGTNARLDWLRRGVLDGDPTNNSASLLLPGGYLPPLDARGDPEAAPAMDLFGAQVVSPDSAVVAGDVRANENIALTAVHTLLAREHNRIVAALPSSLSAEDKFQIARRVVGAEEQYITYNEFLPALGVDLPAYTGYNPSVNATLGNEFATVGYRAHSMIHGEMEPVAPASTYSQAQLDAFRAQGIVVTSQGSDVKLTIPLGVTFGNPDLLRSVGEGPLLKGLADERQYKNDEQIDDTLRSILFQTAKPGALDPSVCGEPVVNPNCFQNVQDLGAIDIQRGRDHGMPTYNQLRLAYGLPARTSYTAITGESTAAFPNDPLINQADPINDPQILDFTQLLDENGDPVEPGSDAAIDDVVTGIRRTTIAARLKAIYGAGNTNKVDAFVGMLCEPHVQGTEFGELQLAIWKKQFQALRDGDRFFYGNDPYLATIKALYGIDYQQTLANLLHLDAGVTTQADVFHVPTDAAPPPPPPPPNALVAAYSFDENAGTTVADASGHGNTGTVSNTNWTSNGHSGSALSFNGSNAWVTVPDSASLDLTTGFTLEAWVKPSQAGGWQTALIKEDPAQTELDYGLYATTDTGPPSAHVLVGNPPDTFVRGTASPGLNSWTHVAAVYDGTTLRIYANGVQQASKAVSGAIDTSTGALRIGGNAIWGEYFAGLIDDVRVYNHALTTAELQTDMTTPVGGSPPPVSGLMAAYSFDENAGTTVADASGHGNTGTASSTTWTSGGHSGSALSFNGSNAWVTVPDSATLDLTTGMTLEAWVKPTQTGGWQTALIKEDAARSELDYGLYASTDTGPPSAHVLVGAPPDTYQRGVTTTPAGTWTHIAATYDGATLRIYVNGALEASKALSGPIGTSSGALRIGGNSIWGEWFAGLIDDVRVYDHALGTTEIRTDMTTPVH